jgi:hypothetical protein
MSPTCYLKQHFTFTKQLFFSSSLWLFHYTHTSAMCSISSSKLIKKSVGYKRDAFYGDGVYFTTLPTRTPRELIVKHNWDGVSVSQFVDAGRVNCCVKVLIPKDDPKLKLVKDNGEFGCIYLYTDDVDLTKFWNEVGRIHR